MIRARYRRIIFFFAQLIATVIFWDILLPRLGLRGWSRLFPLASVGYVLSPLRGWNWGNRDP